MYCGCVTYENKQVPGLQGHATAFPACLLPAQHWLLPLWSTDPLKKNPHVSHRNHVSSRLCLRRQWQSAVPFLRKEVVYNTQFLGQDSELPTLSDTRLPTVGQYCLNFTWFCKLFGHYKLQKSHVPETWPPLTYPGLKSLSIHNIKTLWVNNQHSSWLAITEQKSMSLRTFSFTRYCLISKPSGKSLIFLHKPLFYKQVKFSSRVNEPEEHSESRQCC